MLQQGEEAQGGIEALKRGANLVWGVVVSKGFLGEVTSFVKWD